MPNGHEFECRIGEKLDQLSPHSRLSKVLLFRPDLPEHRRYGFEIDHLIHVCDGLVDRLFIIECKAQPVPVVAGQWVVNYGGGRYDAREQLWNQSVSLMRHLGEFKSGRQVRIEACIVSSNHIPLIQSQPAQDKRVTLHLFDSDQFFVWLSTQKQLIQRVEQSTILTELRQGLVMAELGRPDIANAITFVEACRRTLDHELFRRFPTTEGMTWMSHAAINGTAGMGKSVMLAYILFVLSCDYYVEADDSDGSRRLVSFAEKAQELGIPPHAQRSITAFGMSQKQVRVLQELWGHFERLFGALENGHLLHFHQPLFRIWDASIPDECNILVVDEAHDLKREAHGIIASWKNDDPKRRYLLVACDRHQRLKLAGHNATIIEGLRPGFSSHTLRLSRNYRSPFAVYAGSLALMFRWFARSGPKIIPTRDDLSKAFGFKVEAYTAGEWTLSNINDSHPANHWCYTVSRFLTPQDALRQIQFLRRSDVLWVRFCEEELFFDYEQLSAFTYHPMQGDGASGLIDKYIKGQDFSVVVIEGLPATAFAESPMEPGQEPSEEELQMWQARRQVYLCASRANVFLFFVLKQGAAGESEVENLLGNLRSPDEPDKRLWRLRFSDGHPTRQPGMIDHFDEEAEEPTNQTLVSNIVTLRLLRPVTLRALVASLQKERGLDQRIAIDQVLDAASHFSVGTMRMDTVLPEERLRDFEERLGVLIEFIENAAEDRLNAPQAPKPTTGSREGFALEPAGLHLGITVQQAASLLGMPIQRLLDILPVAYHANRVIEIEADLQRLRLLWKKGEQTPPPKRTETAPSVQRAWRTEIAERLWQRMQQRDFVSGSSMVAKYVIFLAELLRLAPKAPGILLRYRPRSRRYFATSESEILGNHPYASVHQLGGSGLKAMCTLSNESKLHVLRDILGDPGLPPLPPEDINGLLGGF